MRPFILQIWPVALCLSPGCLKPRLGLLCCNSQDRAPTARRTLLRPHLCVPSPRVFPTSGGGRLFPLALGQPRVSLPEVTQQRELSWVGSPSLLPAAPRCSRTACRCSEAVTAGPWRQKGCPEAALLQTWAGDLVSCPLLSFPRLYNGGARTGAGHQEPRRGPA